MQICAFEATASDVTQSFTTENYSFFFFHLLCFSSCLPSNRCQQRWYHGHLSGLKRAKMFLTRSSSESSSSWAYTTSSGAFLLHRNAWWGRGEAWCAEESGTLSWCCMVVWQPWGEQTAGNICVETAQRDGGEKLWGEGKGQETMTTAFTFLAGKGRVENNRNELKQNKTKQKNRMPIKAAKIVPLLLVYLLELVRRVEVHSFKTTSLKAFL